MEKTQLEKHEFPEYCLVFLLFLLPPVGKACAQLSQTPYQLSDGRTQSTPEQMFPFLGGTR